MSKAVDELFASADAEEAEDLAEAEREAAAAGKEPFSYARLEELFGGELPETEPLLRRQYYVRYSEMKTLTELANKLREIANWG